MSDPFRLRLLKNLTAVLEEITPQNGYVHDLRDHVFRGRATFGDKDPLPMISILEPVEESEQHTLAHASPYGQGPWVLLLQGFARDDFTNPTDPAHRLMAEVKQRLTQERVRDRAYDILGMQGKIMELKLSHGVVRPPDELSDKAYFWLRITLMVVENLQDPYN